MDLCYACLIQININLPGHKCHVPRRATAAYRNAYIPSSTCIRNRGAIFDNISSLYK